MELFRPLAESTVRDPPPMYHQLRSADPVHWYKPLDAWVVSRYDDCLLALRQSDVFSSDWRNSGINIPDNLLSIQTLDPPEHDKVHRVLMDAYRKQNFSAIRSRLEIYADKLLHDPAKEDTFDLIADFTAPLAFAAVVELFGIPGSDEKSIVAWSEAIVAAMDSGLTPEAAGPGTQARDNLSATISDWLNQEPELGMLSDLLRGNRNGDISRSMVTNTLRAMLHAGYAPTSRFIAESVLTILSTPGIWDGLMVTGVTDAAVKELLRHSGPVQAVARVCSSDVQLRGHTLPRGSDVILLIAAANRDPEIFPRPDELDFDRFPNHNLGFGWGPHACVGASLARITCSVGVSSLLRNAPRLHIVGEPVHWRHATLRGLKEFPVSKGGPT
jgi:cytochrome P450